MDIWDEIEYLWNNKAIPAVVYYTFSIITFIVIIVVVIVVVVVVVDMFVVDSVFIIIIDASIINIHLQ